MADLFSPIQTGNSTATILDPKNYDYSDGRNWIAIDNDGGIMADKEVMQNA